MHKGWSISMLAVTTVLTVGCGSPNHDPSEGLVAWWRFDEGAGTSAADASGNQNTATILNGAWGEGHADNALAMDGGNDGIVTVPMSDSLRATAGEITVMAWTYRTAEHNVDILGHGYPTLFFGFHGPRFKWQFVRANGRQMACYADPKYVAGLDQWIHVAATYNGWIARLYANGEQVCSKWTWGDIAMPDVPFTMSGYLDGSGRIVDEITGRIDDVRIYDRALSQAEIRRVAGLGN
jgi:hypothetical protein